MESELKRCQFYNDEHSQYPTSVPVAEQIDYETFCVKCNWCGSRGPLKRTRSEAIVAWNQRPNDAVLEAAQKVADEFRKPGLDIGASIDKDTSFWLSIDTIAALLPKRETQEGK